MNTERIVNITSPRSPISPSFLVARYLRSNNYSQSLEAFIREAGLPKDAGSATGDETDSWTIEKTLAEKSAFDKSLNFERTNDKDEEGELRWTLPAPSKPSVLEIPSPSNVLSVSVQPLDVPDGVRAEAEDIIIPPRVLATDATRRFNAFGLAEGHPLVKSLTTLADSPIISHASLLDGKYLLTTCTSGQLNLSRGEEQIDRRNDHAKFAVKVITYQEGKDSTIWIATAGWDMKIFLYSISPSAPENLTLGEPVGIIKLKTLPESILFVRNRETNDLILLVSRSDSTMIHYYDVESPPASPSTESKPYERRLLGTQNLAPGSNAWVAFTPSCLAISPRDPELLAVATSSLSQFMKLMIVRLLFPSNVTAQSSPNEPETQAIQAREALTIQHREDAAILISASTLAPQSNYSTPQVVWRPDGSGVWVNGDDGVIRGLEAKTGKVIASLKDGHEVGSKVRTLWAGWVQVGDEREEWVVSGGFDKKLIVWKVQDDQS